MTLGQARKEAAEGFVRLSVLAMLSRMDIRTRKDVLALPAEYFPDDMTVAELAKDYDEYRATWVD